MECYLRLQVTPSLHVWLSLKSSEQSSPPFATDGFVHVRVLVWVPEAHVFEHEPQLPHVVTPPSTAIRIKILRLSFQCLNQHSKMKNINELNDGYQQTLYLRQISHILWHLLFTMALFEHALLLDFPPVSLLHFEAPLILRHPIENKVSSSYKWNPCKSDILPH